MSAAGTAHHLSGGLGAVREKENSLIDENDLTPKQQGALDAEDFVVFGKASVEQFDDDTPSQKLTMEAIEEKLDDFLEHGLISRRHKDVKVGEPLAEHTLEDDTTIEVGDEQYSFDSGESIETGIRGRDDAEDEFWIVANILNNSEMARETRLRVLNGDLDGFSVTVYVQEYRETPEGQVVDKLDLHSVTIGEDHLIKNEDSKFGLAEFKMMVDRPEVADKVVEALASKLREANMSEEDQQNIYERIVDKASEMAGRKEKAAEGVPDDVVPILDQVEEEIGEDARDSLEEAFSGAAGAGAEAAVPSDGEEQPSDDGSEIPDTEDDMPEDDDQNEPEELKAMVQEAVDEAVAEKLDGGVEPDFDIDIEEKAGDLIDQKVQEAVDEAVSEKMDEVHDDLTDDLAEAAEDVEATVKSVVEDEFEDAAEDVAQKMQTGGTPSPSGGTPADGTDYSDQIAAKFGSGEGE